MKTKRVRDLMVPLSAYATVPEDATLTEAVAALKQSHEDFDKAKYRHRAVLVLGKDRNLSGKVTLHAILKALEPKFEDMFSDTGSMHVGFTRKYQKAIFDSVKLWQDPMDEICRKAAQVQVKNFMVPPREGEMIEPEALLGEAVHQLVLGQYQSLLVVQDKQVVGVLRLTDVAEAVIDEILACNL
mgnify:CR=1 FL=1